MGGMGVRIVRLLMVAALLSLPVSGFALTVNTGDIVNGAVTTPKIADGAVTTAKIGASAVATDNIANGAITDAKITGPISGAKLGAHSHSGADIADGTVTGTNLADGAVTGSKIADGSVTEAKIGGLLSVAKLAGTLAADKIAAYAATRIVHKGPADNINTFNTLAGALNSITDAAADKRYLILVMPGVYNESFTTKQYITIKGADANSVVITSSQSGDAWGGTIVIATNDSPLEDLTVENVNSGIAVAISSTGNSPVDVSINNCIVKADGNVSYGIHTGQGAVSLRNSRVTTTALDYTEAVAADSSTGVMENCTVSAQGNGMYGMGFRASSSQNTGAFSITNSTITGNTVSVLAQTYTVNVRNTLLFGPAWVYQGGTFNAASSQVDGFAYPGSVGVIRLVNCYTSAFLPVSNQ